MAQTYASHPFSQDRAQEDQGSLRPFSGWNNSYSENLLRPLELLNKWGEAFLHPTENADAVRNNEEWMNGLNRLLGHRGLDMSFSWDNQGGGQAEQRYALIPLAWSSERVRAVLDGNSIPLERQLHSGDTDRAYFITVQNGISAEALVTAEDLKEQNV